MSRFSRLSCRFSAPCCHFHRQFHHYSTLSSTSNDLASTLQQRLEVLKKNSSSSLPPKFIQKQQLFIDTLLNFQAQEGPFSVLYPTRDEKIAYMSILGVTMVELNGILRQGRVVWRMRHRDQTMMSNEVARAKVRQYVEGSPQESQFQDLLDSTGLKPQQLKRMIAYMREKRGKVTKEKRDYMKKYMKQREGDWNANDVIILATRLKLSRQQVRQQRQLLMDPSGSITSVTRDIIRQWGQSHKYLSSKQLDALQEETQLSRLQIRNMFQHYRSDAMPLSEQHKERVQQFIAEKESHSEHASRDEIRALSTELGISERKLARYMRYHESHARPLTNHKKLQLVNWFHENDFRDPTAEEVDVLSQKLDLSPHQVRSLVQRLLARAGE